MEDNKELNLKLLLHKMRDGWKKYLVVSTVVLVLSALWIFPQPRTYKSSVSLAPESSESSPAGSLSSLASQFGVNLGSLNSEDAIQPDIYPNVISSTDFLNKLKDIPVETADGKIHATYFTYLKNYQKANPWMMPMIWFRGLFRKKSSEQDAGARCNQKNPTFWISEADDIIFQTMAGNICCSKDDETGIITIEVTDQDKLVCATMVDSVRTHLQDYITRYRTAKARIDVAYYKKLTEEAKQGYVKASRQYAAYTDSHTDAVLNIVNVKTSDLENEMQTKYQMYTAFQQQLQAAEAKVQEKTPAFTVIQSARVPVLPSGPKRVLFCLGMLILGFMGTTVYLLRKEIFGLA